MKAEVSKRDFNVLAVQLIIVAWCAWESKELIYLYQMSSIYDSYPGVFFLLWIFSLFLGLFLEIVKTGQLPQTNINLSLVAALFALLGRVISFEFPGQIGLALALCGLLPPSKKTLFWVIAACCWIHPFKWFVVNLLGAVFVTPVRLLFLFIGLIPFRIRGYR